MKSINIRDTFQTVVLHQTNSKIKFIIDNCTRVQGQKPLSSKYIDSQR